uniref:Uncharacterized protein MANES_03G129700 n=1 Tax=Rhizophora mucronata TaxID=61149 RepID=A0A2P2JST8_RHIMU
MSRISQELSAKEMMTSSFNNFLLLAIAAIAILICKGKPTAISPKSAVISSKCLPTTPKHKLTKLGGLLYSLGFLAK